MILKFNPCRCNTLWSFCVVRKWNSYSLNCHLYGEEFVNMMMLSNSPHAWRCSVQSAFGLWLSVSAFGRWFTLQPLLRGSWVRCLLSAEVQSCSSVRVWSFTAPPGEQEPCRYIMTMSWLAEIKPLCLAVWRTPWKVQHHVFGDSHNETLLCRLWSELMAFPLLDGGKQLGFTPTGVCLPSFPLFYRYDTVFKQLRQTEADSFRGLDFKWPEAHVWFSRKCW